MEAKVVAVLRNELKTTVALGARAKAAAASKAAAADLAEFWL